MSNFKVIGQQEIPLIQSFEKAKLSHLNEVEQMTISWNASWREESLEFYLKTGWCIGMWDESQNFCGYFLAQPLIYMETYTQTLWVEHIGCTTPENFLALVEFAYKYAKEKYLQRILFNKNKDFEKIQMPYKIVRENQNYLEIHTTKMSPL